MTNVINRYIFGGQTHNDCNNFIITFIYSIFINSAPKAGRRDVLENPFLILRSFPLFLRTLVNLALIRVRFPYKDRQGGHPSFGSISLEQIFGISKQHQLLKFNYAFFSYFFSYFNSKIAKTFISLNYILVKLPMYIYQLILFFRCN